MRSLQFLSLFLTIDISLSNSPIQIASFNDETQTWHYDSGLFQRTIDAHPANYKDLPVAIITLVGKRRTGKSFILNYIRKRLEYLESGGNPRDESAWLGPDYEAINGFEFRNGYVDTTQGIWLWPHIFKIRQTGREIVVLLIDSEGLFGRRATREKSAQIFAVTSVLSSTTVFNFKEDLDSNDLDNLALFDLIARSALEPTRFHYPPFQDLVFLSRDWTPNAAMGFGESPAFVNEHLRSNQEDSEDRSKAKTALRAAYERIRAFLVPRPSEVVFEPSFNGSHGVLDSRFLGYITTFVNAITSNISVKKVAGAEINLKLLLKAFTHMSQCNLTGPLSARDSYILMRLAPIESNLTSAFKKEAVLKLSTDEGHQTKAVWSTVFFEKTMQRYVVELKNLQAADVDSKKKALLDELKIVMDEVYQAAGKRIELRKREEKLKADHEKQQKKMREDMEKKQKESAAEAARLRLDMARRQQESTAEASRLRLDIERQRIESQAEASRLQVLLEERKKEREAEAVRLRLEKDGLKKELESQVARMKNEKLQLEKQFDEQKAELKKVSDSIVKNNQKSNGGCYKSQCWAYCGDNWFGGKWCWTQNKEKTSRVSCVNHGDCDASWQCIGTCGF